MSDVMMLPRGPNSMECWSSKTEKAKRRVENCKRMFRERKRTEKHWNSLAVLSDAHMLVLRWCPDHSRRRRFMVNVFFLMMSCDAFQTTKMFCYFFRECWRIWPELAFFSLFFGLFFFPFFKFKEPKIYTILFFMLF